MPIFFTYRNPINILGGWKLVLHFTTKVFPLVKQETSNVCIKEFVEVLIQIQN